MNELDVVIVGAGLSGIGAAVRLKTRCPGKSFAVLEARGAIGGTWDLFRYPGVRSDSDMFTLGYPFHPWRAGKAIADGPSILAYIRETAARYGVDTAIRFQQRVERASWSSAERRWTVETAAGERYRSQFLYLCCGYYSYDAAHQPVFPGAERFRGTIVHPQWWPQDLDVREKRVVVIGSGATAVTLVPALARLGAQVTMLQRSPSYIASLPARDPVADLIRRVLPPALAHRLVRGKNVLLTLGFYQLCRRFPRLARHLLKRNAARLLPKDFAVDRHFTPRYEPWDQRLCLVPDDDLFVTLAEGKAAIETDTIETFTETGIRLASGKELAADIVVTATGLKLLPIGGIRLDVDGAAVEASKTLVYKGLMLSGVPNLAWCVGYTNASWTLRADLSSRYVCRLLRFMDRRGYTVAMPRHEPGAETRPLLNLSSGYVARAAAELPRQGARAPWYLRQNYLLDRATMVHGRVDDAAMSFA